MLEESSFQHIVSWGPQGDCFVVKVPLSTLSLSYPSKLFKQDMNEFTKSILPRLFKHSNFASFVRQLNKYDFHKVKNTDDPQFGEHVSKHSFFLFFSYSQPYKRAGLFDIPTFMQIVDPLSRTSSVKFPLNVNPNHQPQLFPCATAPQPHLHLHTHKKINLPLKSNPQHSPQHKLSSLPSNHS